MFVRRGPMRPVTTALLSILFLAGALPQPAVAMPSPSVATSRDDIGIGASVTTGEHGLWPTGLYLGTPDEDLAVRLLWSKVDGTRAKLRSWSIEGGYWGPAPGFTVDEPTLWDLRYGPKKREEDIDDDDYRVWLAAPHFNVGSDKNRAQRFRYRSDATFLWNLASYGHVPVAKGYIGPLVGTGIRAYYPPKDSADPSATGSAYLVGGLLAGAVVADLVLLNGAGRILRSPFAGEHTIVEAGAIATLDLTPKSVPLAIQLTGRLEQELGTGAPLWWTAGLTVLIVREI